jgi:hypothetical protein
MKNRRPANLRLMQLEQRQVADQIVVPTVEKVALM